MDIHLLLDLAIDSFLAHFLLPLKTEVLWHSLKAFEPDNIIIPTFIAFLGSTTGYMVSYLVGQISQKYAPRLPVESPKFQKTKRVFTHYLFWLLLIPWVPFLPILAFIQGFLQQRWWLVLITVMLGRIIYYAAAVL